MKGFLLLLTTLMAISVCFGQDNGFFDKVLNYDNCSYCYFLSVEVESAEYRGKVVVENDDLFKFLSKTKGFDKAQYRAFMKDVLIADKTLPLENVSLDSYGDSLKIEGFDGRKFRVATDWNRTEEAATKGCVAFLKFYFLGESLESIRSSVSEDCAEFIMKQKKDLLLINKIGFAEQTSVIRKLFEWEIPTRIDGYSGLLTIRKVDFQKKAPNKTSNKQ